MSQCLCLLVLCLKTNDKALEYSPNDYEEGQHNTWYSVAIPRDFICFLSSQLASSFEKSIFSQTPLTPWTMTVRLDNTRYSKDWCHNNCRPGELKGQKDVPWPEIITDDIGPHVTTYLSPMQHWDKGGGEFHFVIGEFPELTMAVVTPLTSAMIPTWGATFISIHSTLSEPDGGK